MIRLPEELNAAVDELVASTPPHWLSTAAEAMSRGYRDATPTNIPHLTSDLLRMAYCITRLPATFAASRAVFSRVLEHLPHLRPKTVLDLGAGCGAAAWAAQEAFSDLAAVTLVERDASFIEVGKNLAKRCQSPAIREGSWINANLTQLGEVRPQDMVVFSYSLGELDAVAGAKALEQAWSLTQQVLIIVEPGTPHGFEAILRARKQLIDLQGFIVAPCPHLTSCPLGPAKWCHFSQRLERTSLHRRLKKGDLAYEDEKYSYLVVAKEVSPSSRARILHVPMKRSGHVRLCLCSPQGILETVVSRRHKEPYRCACDRQWGDSWEFDTPKP